jgi:hypothetical protein
MVIEGQSIYGDFNMSMQDSGPHKIAVVVCINSIEYLAYRSAMLQREAPLAKLY